MFKKFFMISIILPLIASITLSNLLIVNGEEPISTIRDTYPDTWVATDTLGRVTPVSGQIIAARDKKVGIFYFLWHNNDSTNPIYDTTKAFNEGGVDAVWKIIPEGPLGYAHYWAEPYFGYYKSDDEWIIRKHTSMLVNAGVDFVFFDATNGVMYQAQYRKILKIWDQIRKEGGNTPQFMFFCGDRTDFGKSDMNILWSSIYKKDLYKDLWFMWEGKPLVFGDLALVPKEIQDL